jgi:serine/threonine protein kinase/tetratricopeptide (TPR) repeat protein
MPIGDSETVQVMDTSALPPGSDFGPRYRIEKLLGQGGMGRVYKAYDKELDRTVAIKVVRQGMMGESDALKRFKQELLLASKISHKNILRIHDMGTVGDTRFITMAFVEGQDLYQILRDNPKMPMERTLKFARALAEALAAAHAEGVVHRDLKPQNILVDKDDQIYVSDFGLAKSFEEGAVGMTKTGAFMGTPRYMSPEQVEGKPVDQRSDLYAYGLILYEMLAGDVPFTGESTLKVMYQRIQETPKSPKLANPSLPNWLVRITMRCLERDPEKRYQSAYEILADLQGSKSASGSRSVQIQLPEFAERKWVWYVAGAVALLILVFAIPPVRHLIPGLGVKSSGGSGISGIPTLSEGKFVAILPFKILGDDQSLGYVAEGLNEALSAKLFQMKDLRLSSDTAVATVSDKDPLEKTARKLGANLIVQGVIQGGTNKMSIIVNLMDIPDAKKLWSQQFSGVAKDLLTIEDQISTQLVATLALKPTNEEMARAEAHPTENIEAYDLYLKGRNSLRGQQDLKNVETAISYFEEALKKDPGFALAYAGVSDASLVMYLEKKDNFWSQKSLAAAQQAERINDKLPEVHFALGRVYNASGKSAEAIAELKRALELAPNSDDGYRGLGKAYLALGQKDQAIQAYQKAVQINPYYWFNSNSLGTAYSRLGEYDKALSAFRKVTELEPANSFGYLNQGVIYIQLGKNEESIPYLQKALQIQPDYKTYSDLGTAYYNLKRYADAVPMFEKAVEMSPNDESFVGNLADAYRWSGQRDKANATYDRAIALAFKQLEVNPRDSETMGDLALYYAKKGNSAQAVDFIHRARAVNQADVNLIYVEATVFALSNRPSDALKSLREALQKGYSVEEAANDPELGAIQKQPEFAKMVAEFKKSK